MRNLKILHTGILFMAVLFLSVLLQAGPAAAVQVPEGSYTPAGSSLTYTFTGDSTAPNGFVANVERYQSAAVVNGELRIDRTIQYKPRTGAPEIKVNVTGILRGVFSGCTSMNSLILPDTISYIGQEAFSNCTNLTAIRTEASGGIVYNGALAAKEIESRAFYGCTSLAGVALGEQLAGSGGGQTIHSEAFMNCTALTSLEIGPAVTWIAGGAFACCSTLNGLSGGIKVRDNASYFVEDGILYYRESDRSNVLLCAPAGTAFGQLADFPENVTQIKEEAFYGCIGLSSIEIPDTVRSIGEKAFYNCIILGNADIPASVTQIGSDAFTGCNAGLRIQCAQGSAAETYADSHDLEKSMECTVTFLNTVTQEVVTRTVMSGQTVSPPLGWERDGYILRWSDDFNADTVVSSNKTVSTVWTKLYTVTFRDGYTGNQYVAEGIEEGKSAEPPNWAREGYRLTWSTEGYKNVTSDMIVTAIWLVSITDDPIGPVEEKKYETGDFITIDNIIYKITNKDALKVRVVGMEDETMAKVTIPDIVAFGGDEYKVTCINAGAFRGNEFITKVTLGSNIRSIENHAFYACTSLKKFVINSRNIINFSNDSFKKTPVKLKVYVPTTKLISTYRTGMLDAGMKTKAKVVLVL